MIHLKSILLKEQRVMALEIRLPATHLNFVFNTKGFLCGNYMNMTYFIETKSAVCIMKLAHGSEQLLESEVVSCNKKAKSQGIIVGMLGEEALALMNESKA